MAVKHRSQQILVKGWTLIGFFKCSEIINIVVVGVVGVVVVDLFTSCRPLYAV